MAETRELPAGVDLTNQEFTQTLGEVRKGRLATYILDIVKTYETERDANNDQRELDSKYYHIWRGKYSSALKTRDSEWSRLIHPASSAAVDTYVGEIQSATIDMPTWFQLADDDPEDNIKAIQDQLKIDLHSQKAKIIDSMTSLLQIGAIYGRVGAEVWLDKIPQLTIGSDGVGNAVVQRGKDRRIVRIDPIFPSQVIFDTSAQSFEDSEGHGRRSYVSKASVRKMQAKGIYDASVNVKTSTVTDPLLLDASIGPSATAEVVELIKWQGLVPRGLLDDSSDLDRVIPDLNRPEQQITLEVDEDDLVEAIVVVTANHEVLQAQANPNILQDRMFLYWRFEKVPGCLDGRGVIEKAFNPQKALDANLRAQLEVTAKVVHPIFGVDITMFGGRGTSFSQKPGAVNKVNGDPNRAMSRVDLGDVSPSLFSNTDKLEQLVSLATASFDPSVISAAGGIANEGIVNLVASTFVKRSKSAITSFNEDIIVPFVNLASRLYMQYEPQLYPPMDVTFQAVGGMGALAREIEQAQLINLMKTMPAATPGWWMILRSIVQNSNIQDREVVLLLIEQQLEAALNPQPSERELAEVEDIRNKIRNRDQDTRTNFIRANAEIARVAMELARSDTEDAVGLSKILLNLAKTEAEEAGTQMPIYHSQMENLVSQSNVKINEGTGANVDRAIQVAGAAAAGITDLDSQI